MTIDSRQAVELVMDVLEFEESEVMFSDYSSDQSEGEFSDNGVDQKHEHNVQSNGSRMILRRRKSINKPRKISFSLPINIPETGINFLRYDSDLASPEQSDVDCDDEDYWMKLPPHLIVERRRANEDIARSVPLKQRKWNYI